MSLSISVGVLTYNAISFLRMGLLCQTLRSLRHAFPSCKLLLLDNGSTDGTADFVRSLDFGRCYVAADGDHTPGRGQNVLVGELLKFGSDLIIMSDDDILWCEGAQDKIVNFWSAAPDDVVVLCAMLEPEWHWNVPIGPIEYGGVRALCRASAPTAAWTTRARDWPLIGEFKTGFGHDHDKCLELSKRGLKVAQIDLARHLGWEHSSHENEAIKSAVPLDKKKWDL